MERLTNLEFYNKNKEVLIESIKRGMTSSIIMDYITIDSFYKNELKNNSKMQALENTSEEFNLSFVTIYKAINFLKSH